MEFDLFKKFKLSLLRRKISKSKLKGIEIGIGEVESVFTVVIVGRSHEVTTIYLLASLSKD
jgi:hypothetical protein